MLRGGNMWFWPAIFIWHVFAQSFFKFHKNGDIRKLKAWSFRLWKNDFCRLYNERARALQSSITIFLRHPVYVCSLTTRSQSNSSKTTSGGFSTIWSGCPYIGTLSKTNIWSHLGFSFLFIVFDVALLMPNDRRTNGSEFKNISRQFYDVVFLL